ncbi:MAG: hypothetical protein GY847_34110 [Proteobacteria bacterium]|nr:hypothetical protein [Pseudomonadota bacterium]
MIMGKIRTISFRFLGICVIAAILLVCSGTARAQVNYDLAYDKIEKIQIQIDEQNLEWEAGITSMSFLSEEEFRAILIPLEIHNAGPPPRSPEDTISLSDLPPSPMAVDPSLPQHSWTKHEGGNWMTPIRNQGMCGSCTIFASIGAIEGAINIANGNPNLNMDLSEQNVLCNTFTTCFTGGMNSTTHNRARSAGIPDEKCQPYNGSDFACNVCKDWKQRVVKIKNAIPNSGIQRIKQALAQGPLSTCMDTYADFQNYRGGVYKPSGGSPQGGHAIVIVGWNDNNNSWYSKNSWGPTWGSNGYFEIQRETSGFAGSKCDNHLPVIAAGDIDIDADADADADADNDTDADSDTGEDTGSDTDTDIDTDIDVDNDTDSDTDGDADGDADSDGDSDADSDSDADADNDSDSDSDGDADGDDDDDDGDGSSGDAGYEPFGFDREDATGCRYVATKSWSPLIHFFIEIL